MTLFVIWLRRHSITARSVRQLIIQEPINSESELWLRGHLLRVIDVPDELRQTLCLQQIRDPKSGCHLLRVIKVRMNCTKLFISDHPKSDPAAAGPQSEIRDPNQNLFLQNNPVDKTLLANRQSNEIDA